MAGDSCEDGVDHSPLRLPCPGFQGFFTLRSFVVILLIALISGIVYNSREQVFEFIARFLEALSKKGFRINF